MSLHTFWAQHADAVGAALTVLGLAVIALWRILRHAEKVAAAQRAVFRAETRRQRKEFARRYRALLGIQTGNFDTAATQAIGLTRRIGPVRTPLTDVYVCDTVEQPIPYRLAESPVWTEGGRD